MSDMNNPPAFPNMAPDSCGPHIDKRDGMTLRDYFAGQALMAAWLAMDKGYYEADEGSSDIAVCAYQFADAMLAARETIDD